MLCVLCMCVCVCVLFIMLWDLCVCVLFVLYTFYESVFIWNYLLGLVSVVCMMYMCRYCVGGSLCMYVCVCVLFVLCVCAYG